MSSFPDVDALNYPYIRVRDAAWLKRTLLIFPHVVRITPVHSAPPDNEEIRPFTAERGRRGPLLRAARLDHSSVVAAQLGLIGDLKAFFAERPDFVMAFQRKEGGLGPSVESSQSIWDAREASDAPFQISRYKLFPDLVEYLLANRLAWVPDQQASHGEGYVEMDGRLGRAVMATLATACAAQEGMRVITEFPALHGRLIGVRRDKILEAALLEKLPAPPVQISGELIGEFLVHRYCNVDALSSESFANLKDERILLARFRAELETLAADLPENMTDGDRLNERLRDVVSDIFERWRQDQSNLNGFGRNFFTEGLSTDVQSMVEKLVDGAVKGAAGAAVLHEPIVLGAVAGLAVAVVFRAAQGARNVQSADKNSPYRYLTILEKEGVTFSFSR
jgi:hypothetical protein